MFSKIMRPRTLLILILLMAVAALTYGFAAQITLSSSNTVVASQELALTDYTATLAWTLNAGADKSVNPTATVTFSSGVPTNVYVGWSDGSTWDWTATCTETSLGSGVWNCPLGATVNVYDVAEVEVVATGPN